MKQYKLDWINNGKEFELPDLTIGDVKKAQLAVLDVLREHKDIEGTRQLERYLSQETGFALLRQVLKRVDPTVTDTMIEDNLTFVQLNELTNILFDKNKDMLKESGVDVRRPPIQPSSVSKKT